MSLAMERRVVTFRVVGKAEPKGSVRAFTPKGWTRPILTSTNPRVKGWQQLVAGEIDFVSVQQQLSGAGIELRGGAADEAPGAYKRLADVLAAHGDTVEVLHRLTPIGVAMAGEDTFDPYKD